MVKSPKNPGEICATCCALKLGGYAGQVTSGVLRPGDAPARRYAAELLYRVPLVIIFHLGGVAVGFTSDKVRAL